VVLRQRDNCVWNIHDSSVSKVMNQRLNSQVSITNRGFPTLPSRTRIADHVYDTCLASVLHILSLLVSHS